GFQEELTVSESWTRHRGDLNRRSFMPGRKTIATEKESIRW
ncbi:unnamed protein product, partial [Brassica oleracea var. botrytis]